MAMTPGGGLPSAPPPPRPPRNGTGGPRFAGKTPSMARVLHWGVLMGGLVVIVDLATMAVSRRLASTDVGGLDAFNYLLNAILFSIAGASAYRDTGAVRLGALTGLLAGVLDGVVVGAAVAIVRPPDVPPGATADQILLDLLAQNAFLGTVLATASAGISSIARRRTRG